MLKPIETIYNGNKFRSRLEARWAVFFDQLNVKYSYEKEGYDLDGVWYLPDFWMPDWKCWIEIKPEKTNRVNCADGFIEKEEFRKCQKLAKKSQNVVMLIGGDPWVDTNKYDETGKFEHLYDITLFSASYLKRENDKKDYGIESDLPFYDDRNFSRLTEFFYTSESRLYGHLKSNYLANPQYFDKPFVEGNNPTDYIDIDKIFYLKKHGDNNPIWNYGIIETELGFVVRNNKIGITIMPEYDAPCSDLVVAFEKARQARF